MKVKELHRNVNVAWSPQAHYPLMLAAGTAAQQLDASFSTNASLDLYSINLHQPGYDMQLNVSVPSEQRFHKLIWGAYGNNPSGIIIGGCDHGKINIYSAASMLANDSSCLISSTERHKGPVKAMDFNPFQSNLLATGATESEIYIWDLNNTNKPMSPGSKSMPAEDVQHIAWNKQVQHILASTFSQRCVIWDLKKNEAIIKLTDANSRVRWKSVQWHPDVATQLCLASEEDQTPIIELWDLRFATSPLKTLHNHQRGILSIAWNQHDPDLLLSCAKDNRILCWNPNSDAPNGEVICELAQTNQWNFDVLWCPRNPDLIVGTSFDGVATVYSILGGHNQISAVNSNKIVESFPGMDPFAQPPPSVVHHTDEASILKKAPKWLKRPFGASFGFGGKLITFENEPLDPNVPLNSNRKVFVSQVITNADLIQRSSELEAALKTGQYSDFCKGKADNAEDVHTKKVWSCIGAYFGENVTLELLELLGFNIDEMNNKLNQFVPPPEIDNITKGISKLNNGLNGNPLDGSAAFDAIAENEQSRKSPSRLTNRPDSTFKIETSKGEEGLITQAILLGNIEAAVALCFNNKRYADAIILSMTGGPELLAQTQYRYFSEHSGALNSLINSLVSENWLDVVKNCDISYWKEALVGVFTHVKQQDRSALCDILGDRLAKSENANLRKESQICFICSGNLNKTVEAINTDIQETVELVTVMQKALEFQSMNKINIEGNIAAILTRYAELLAAEGDLEAALNYLGNSQEPRILMLKDRLQKALCLVQTEPQRLDLARNTPYSNIYQQRKSLSTTMPGGFNPVQNTVNPALQQQQPNWNTAPAKQTYSGIPYAGPITNQPYQNQQSPYAPSVPVPASTLQDPYAPQTPLSPGVPPPPPTSATAQSQSGSRPPSVGPHSRSKYILDPSVKSAPSYGTPGGYNNYGSQTFSPPGGFASPSPYGMQQPQPAPAYGTFSNAIVQNTIYNPAEPELHQQPRTSQTTGMMNQSPAQSQQPTVYTPNTNISQPPPIGSAYPNDSAMYLPGNQTSGWNDPPTSGKLNKSQVKSEFQQQNPISHPLGAAPQSEPMVYQQDPSFHQQGYQDQQAMYNQNYQNIPQFNRNTEAPVQPAQIARAPEPEKPKAPIPEEHKQLQVVLNELKDRCFEMARNPQVKRKIEDVSRKLEVFYDCLREKKISANTLQGLHQISEMIQSGDYPGGLTVHTQLVSGPDFSQIASFMPGIKVLLQTALQLGVYIR